MVSKQELERVELYASIDYLVDINFPFPGKIIHFILLV